MYDIEAMRKQMDNNKAQMDSLQWAIRELEDQNKELEVQIRLQERTNDSEDRYNS